MVLYNIFIVGAVLKEEFYFYNQFINLIRMENVKTKSGLCFEAFNKQVEGKQTSICVLSNKKGTEARFGENRNHPYLTIQCTTNFPAEYTLKTG